MTAWQSAFVEQSTLTAGHSNTINHLSFSPDGTYLASCGDDNSLIIWKTEEGRQLYRLIFKSPVDCAIWHPVYPDTLIAGCDNGHLFQLQDFSPQTNSAEYQIELGVRGTIQCLTYDKTSRLLAVGVGTEVYTIREVTSNNYAGVACFPLPTHNDNHASSHDDSRELNGGFDNRLRPVGVEFLESGSQLLACYMAHGVICWDTGNRDVLWRFVPESFPHIGRSALSPNKEEIAVYNFADGISVYSLGGSGLKRRSKKHLRLPKKPRTKHAVYVAYINDGHGLVCGMTTGDVCIWDVASGDVYQALVLDKDDVVQAVAGCTRGAYSYIVTGSTDKGQSTNIKVWRAKCAPSGPAMPAAIGNKVSHVVRIVRDSERLSRTSAFFKKWVLPGFYGTTVFLMCHSVLHNLPWAEYRNAIANMILSIFGIFLIAFHQVGNVLQAQYRQARGWVEEAILEQARLRFLQWLRVDELVADRGVPARTA